MRTIQKFDVIYVENKEKNVSTGDTVLILKHKNILASYKGVAAHVGETFLWLEFGKDNYRRFNFDGIDVFTKHPYDKNNIMSFLSNLTYI